MISKLLGGDTKGFYPYGLDYGCRMTIEDEVRMERTQGVPTNQKIWTYSTWVKRFKFSTAIEYLYLSTDLTFYDGIRFNTGGHLNLFSWTAAGPGYQMQLLTINKYMDVAAWYHIVVAYDNTQATASNRIKLYVNNVEPKYSSEIYPDQNETALMMNTNAEDMGINGLESSWYSNTYRSEVNFIDGQQLTPSDFGRIRNGVWIPKRYEGTYGNNGFHLDFSDSANLGDDVSGNGNDLTATNFTTADQVKDSPTNNFCVMNSIYNYYLFVSNDTFENGNLEVSQETDATNSWAWGTMAIPTTGKWYFEAELDLVGLDSFIGISEIEVDKTAIVYRVDGQRYVFGGWAAYGSTFTTGDIIGVAVDRDAGTVTFYKNNVSQGAISTNIADNMLCMCFMSHATNDTRWKFDFGQLGFTYTPPAGHDRLCSLDLPEIPSSIIEGNKGFDTVLYTGTGAENSIADLEFSPDLVWIKERDDIVEHVLQDSVRGAGLEINSDSPNIESGPIAESIKSFDSNGFTLGTNGNYNGSGDSYVSWNWKADPNYGFDIVSYTGTGVARTVPHNLGAVPGMMIVKNRETTADWYVYHKYLNVGLNPEQYRLRLNELAVELPFAVAWNDTAPTSSVFTVGTSVNTNKDGDELIAYLFTEIPGFSRIFFYDGNGLEDGPFINCGFSPRFVMVKRIDGVAAWTMWDSLRPGYNIIGGSISANSDAVENTASEVVDLLSNGFKIRGDSAFGFNADGAEVIGFAFAEHPFKYANAR
jgi:hypothetical protein